MSDAGENGQETEKNAERMKCFGEEEALVSAFYK